MIFDYLAERLRHVTEAFATKRIALFFLAESPPKVNDGVYFRH